MAGVGRGIGHSDHRHSSLTMPTGRIEGVCSLIQVSKLSIKEVNDETVKIMKGNQVDWQDRKSLFAYQSKQTIN